MICMYVRCQHLNLRSIWKFVVVAKIVKNNASDFSSGGFGSILCSWTICKNHHISKIVIKMALKLKDNPTSSMKV